MTSVAAMAPAVVASSDTLIDGGKKPGHNVVENTQERLLRELRSKYILTVGLHIGLVIMHLVLVAIHFPHKYENRTSVPLGREKNASIIIIVVSQVFAVVYLATLVNLMQQLSLRRNLNIRQTVTAFHDKHAAWAGPGAALTALHRQSHLRTAFSGLFFVALYLFGASALHITTPSLLSLFSGNKTSAGYASLDSSHPYLLSPLISPFMFSNGIPVLPTLGLMQKANATLGLHGNILFDVPRSIYQAYYDRPLAQKFQIRNATAFNVTCGNLAGVEQVGKGNASSWFLKTPVRNVTDGDYRPLRVFTPYGIRFIPQEYMVQNGDFASQTLVLVASVNITDSEGHNGSTFAVDPPFNPLPSNWSDSFVQDRPKTFDPVVIACSLASSSPGITLDPISRNITQDSIAANPRKTRRVWSVWTEPPRSDDPLIQSWASIFLDTSTSPVIATTCDDPHLWPNSDNLCQMNDYLTVVERYVNDRLGIRPWSESSSKVYNTSVNLHDLENVLEDLTAAVFWGTANFPGTKLDSAEPRDFGNVVNVTTYEPNVQLTINEIPLLVGLLCSVGLLCIALYLVRWPRETQIGTELDMVGLLQFIWLLGKGSDVQNTVSDVTQPSTDNLRAAGMAEVTLSTLVHRASSNRRSNGEN